MAVGGTPIRDPATGKLLGHLRQTLAERFPTGRKHCGKCGCWRHLCDFGPRGDWVQSWCRMCCRRHARGGTDQPKASIGRTKHLARRRAWEQQRIAEIKADPEKHQVYLEDQRIRQHDRRRAAGVPAQNRKSINRFAGPRVDGTAFLRWLDLAKPWLDDREGDAVSAVRTRGLKIYERLIDDIMTRNGAADQFAILYPPDELDEVA